MAKDLNKNTILKNIKENKLSKKEENTDKNNQHKIKKSTSNPFLYFNERKDEIMEIKPEK